MHVVVNPTWRCQLSCRYCWLPHTAIRRTAKEHTWQQWAKALSGTLPPESIVDFSGGEPFLFDGLPKLLAVLAEHETGWAVTTNALETDAIRRLAYQRPGYCAAINVSDHAGNHRAVANIALLMEAGYRVAINRLDHAAAGHHVDNASGLLPFQDWKRGTALDGKRRACNAGVNHWVADPSGDVWRCMVSMQLGHPPVANLFRPPGERVQIEQVCDFGCSTCYRDTPGAWCIDMQVLGEGI